MRDEWDKLKAWIKEVFAELPTIEIDEDDLDEDKDSIEEN